MIHSIKPDRVVLTNGHGFTTLTKDELLPMRAAITNAFNQMMNSPFDPKKWKDNGDGSYTTTNRRK